MKDKNNAVIDYLETVKNSWTYQKMTPKEQRQIRKALMFADCQDLVSGSYLQRQKQCIAIYTAFLYALDYDEYNASWRETEETERPLF